VHIGCVIASLGSGGAERVMLTLCEAWAARGDTVTLFTFDDDQQDFFAVPTGVERAALNIAGVSSSIIDAARANIRRVRILRGALRSLPFDVIVSFTDRTNVSTLLAARGLGVPIIISERTDPRHHDIGAVWSALRRIVYPSAAVLVVQTEHIRTWAETQVSSTKVRVIGNPLREITAPVAAAGARPNTIAAVGRLVSSKGFDVLLSAFSLVKRQHPAWRLVISGEGPQRALLESQVSELGLDSSVSLSGRTSNVNSVLAEAAVFVLSSRYEGFPNALLEAMASGCACVATDCDSGPSDLLQNGDVGLLVPVDDPNALAEAMMRLMANPTYRSQLGDAARVSTGRFALTRILQEWDAVFDAARSRAS
jgi:glycosyltransferase involved in cell wall biosynthesis